MEQRSYNPYILGKKVFDLCEKKIPAIEEEVGQHGIDISILGSQNASQERDITDIKGSLNSISGSLNSITGSLNSLGTRVTALEAAKAISSTPFETGETYKGKPVKKVSLALGSVSISTSEWTSLGVTLEGLNVGQVLDAHIIDAYGYVVHIPINFKQAIISDSANVTAKRNANDVIDTTEALVFTYIEKDPVVPA